MTTGVHTGASADRQAGPKPGTWRRVGGVCLMSLVVWAGEAAIGLVPLLTHFTVSSFSNCMVVAARCCPVEGALEHCCAIPETPYAEMNILAVVIAGLGLLSLIQFGPHGRKTRFTPMTFLAAISSIGLLIVGSLLYALTASGISAGSENVTREVLGLAMVVSFYLTLEEAWLEVLEESCISGPGCPILMIRKA
jgi:hypothetical protein